MSTAGSLHVRLEPHPVTLHYPGAEGVRFNDAVLVLSNDHDGVVSNTKLTLRVQQGDKTLMDSPVDLAGMGIDTQLVARGSSRVSVFRALQHHVAGFGSKVNLFGYKSVLNWSFRVEAELSAGPGDRSSGAWNLVWRPAAADSDLVEVDIDPV